MWRKAMIQLGLSDDEDLYPDDADPEPERSGGGDARQGAGRSRQQSSTAAPPVGVGRLPPPSPFGEESSAIGSVRPFNPRGEEEDRQDLGVLDPAHVQHGGSGPEHDEPGEHQEAACAAVAQPAVDSEVHARRS